MQYQDSNDYARVVILKGPNVVFLLRDLTWFQFSFPVEKL